MPVAEVNGRVLNVAHAYGTARTCAVCGTAFTVTSITGVQLYCGEPCKERAQWRRESKRPEIVMANRARCRAWAAENRSVSRSQPWLLGPPPFGEYLPGGAVALRVSPAPQWPIELRNTRALHGLVTDLLGVPHHPNQPGFTLIPSDWSPVGWGVYVPNPELALSIANRQREGVLFDRHVLVTCGPMHRIKAPRVTKRGRRRVRIDCLTPVCIRAAAGSAIRTAPTSGNLCSTAAVWLPQRLGVSIGYDDVRMLIVERSTLPQSVPMLGKYGVARGFVGHLVVETNAVGHWLLKCAETLGLGGKTAFGFGRIRVTE